MTDTFRKKPTTVRAARWGSGADLNTDVAAIEKLIGPFRVTEASDAVIIRTTEGESLAQYGDWIIRDSEGRVYPCKPDIFAATYEPVDDSEASR